MVEEASWHAMEASLDARGYGVLPGLLTPQECASLRATYGDDARFRSRVVMARHGFGRGEYKYFAYPLPPQVASLRAALYPRLAPIANRWNALLRSEVRYPDEHETFLARCHDAGQLRPTPLLLRYVAGDYNCLHQDLYGAHVFPLQAAILLSKPRDEFEGGELVTVEGTADASRAEVVALGQGDAVVFTVHERPVRGKRGYRRAVMRHGVSALRRGERYTMGVIFHDAS